MSATKGKQQNSEEKRIKHLIVLCDGTGQSSSRAGAESDFPTNVKNFSDCLLQCYKKERKGKNREVEQITYYQSGIGTSSVSKVSEALQAGIAYGIDDIILDAYYFLCSNYQKGDEIFIFGFSRGAFIARVLANLVVTLGVLRMDVSWMIARAWKQYMKDDNKASFDFFLKQLHLPDYKHRTQHVKVKVLGVWDTVAAVGLNSSCQQYDIKLHWGIENVYHALALDEIRYTFGPTLFHHPDPKDKPEWLKTMDENASPPCETKCNLKQCWFAGAHTDIGGGYPSSHQSNITLAWMIDNCQDKLGFDVSRVPASKWNSPEELKHDAPGKKWKKIINGHHRPGDMKYGSGITESRGKGWVERKYPAPDWDCGTKENIYSGHDWGCGIVRDSYDEFKGVRWQYRCPGNYSVCDKGHQKAAPGSWGVSRLSVTGTLTAASYLNPWSYNWKNSSNTNESRLCTDPSCSHQLAPQSHATGATNQTIHPSVFTRWQAAEKARQDAKDGKGIRSEYEKETGELIRHQSDWLKDWNPKSLEHFRRDKERRVWIGKCAVHEDKEFEIPEEPEIICADGGMLQQLLAHDPKTWDEPTIAPLTKARDWTFWCEKDFDCAEYMAQINPDGKSSKYVDEENCKLLPRSWFRRK